jgi:hypothetical protein
MRTDDKQNPLSVQAPHLLEFSSLQFDVRLDGEPSANRISCQVIWRDAPVWAPRVQALLANRKGWDSARWREIVSRHVDVTCIRWQGDNQQARSPGDLEFQAIQEFFERWNPRSN